MSLASFDKLEGGVMTNQIETLRFGDGKTKETLGVCEGLCVEVGDFLYPADFKILEMANNEETHWILGRPFLRTAKANIDVWEGRITIYNDKDEFMYFDCYPIIPTGWGDEFDDDENDDIVGSTYTDFDTNEWNTTEEFG